MSILPHSAIYDYFRKKKWLAVFANADEIFEHFNCTCILIHKNAVMFKICSHIWSFGAPVCTALDILAAERCDDIPSAGHK